MENNLNQIFLGLFIAALIGFFSFSYNRLSKHLLDFKSLRRIIDAFYEQYFYYLLPALEVIYVNFLCIAYLYINLSSYPFNSALLFSCILRISFALCASLFFINQHRYINSFACWINNFSTKK